MRSFELFLGPHRSGSGFRPINLPGCALWLDAADTSTITVGTGASAWADKSGNNFNASQASGSAQPATGTRSINGRNALDFDGAGDRMDLPSGLIATVNNQVTCFVVTKADSYAAGDFASKQAIRFLVGSGEYNFGWGLSGTRIAAAKTSGFAYTNLIVSSDTTNPHIDGFFDNGTNLFSFRDGTVSAGVTRSTTGTGVAGVVGADAFGGLAFDGLIGEIIMYNRNLTNDEKNAVGSYLAGKWGVTWTNI